MGARGGGGGQRQCPALRCAHSRWPQRDPHQKAGLRPGHRSPLRVPVLQGGCHRPQMSPDLKHLSVLTASDSPLHRGQSVVRRPEHCPYRLEPSRPSPCTRGPRPCPLGTVPPPLTLAPARLRPRTRTIALVTRTAGYPDSAGQQDTGAPSCNSWLCLFPHVAVRPSSHPELCTQGPQRSK